MQLIECVPNFSEGRDLRVINEIAQSITKINGVHLLNIDSNYSANRTVMTFVGEPAKVCHAAFQAIRTAQTLIDMRKHQGEHPRIGATDVCPLVPLADVTMKECIELSHVLAKVVAEELKIPIYLYAQSALFIERYRLAFIRKGQYEGMEKRILEETFSPDYGHAQFNSKSGATAIGARNLLVAYNINLDTQLKQVAQAIAAHIRRERGPLSNPPQAAQEYYLQECTSIGWYIEEYKRAQISMNLMDYRKTSLHQAFEEVKRLSALYDVSVTGSEIIGLVPLQPMLQAGRFYLTDEERSTKFQEEYLVEKAITSLNLSETKSFIASEKILDYRLQSLALPFNISSAME